ncbi:hypothetical protein ESCOCK376M_23035 [Escherichia coli]|nr:hypothetical protein BANRA_01930 [Escherichia coli]VCY74034.1 hypothetical protein BANRA_04488 [Escherichia coli]
MLASDPGRQIADVPTPDLIRCNGPEYIRPVYTGIHGIVSSTAWLISVHDKNLIQKQYKCKRKANAVCNTCSLQTKLELLLN